MSGAVADAAARLLAPEGRLLRTLAAEGPMEAPRAGRRAADALVAAGLATACDVPVGIERRLVFARKYAITPEGRCALADLGDWLLEASGEVKADGG